MANRLLGILLTLALLAMGAFAWSVWSDQPLPTSALFAPPAAPGPGDPVWNNVTPGWHAALVCPRNTCDHRGEGALESPVFDLSPQALYALARAYILSQPRVVDLRDDPGGLRLDVVQRSAILGIPETVSLKVESDGGERRSTLVLVSRSRPQAWEPGGNKARVATWLGGIERAARVEPPFPLTDP